MSNKSRLLSFAGLAALAGLPGFRADAAPPEEKPADPPIDKPADPPEEKPAEPPAKEPADENEPAIEASVDTVLAADAVRLATEARAAGFAEANARMKTVLEAKEGKANLNAAIFLLCNSDASADACIAHLASLPPQNGIASTTPKIELTGGKPAEIAAEAEKPGEDGAAETTKLWAGVQAQHNAMTRGGNGINLAV